MSQGTHAPKSKRRERFNDLLESFGKEIKKWATGKTKGPFPNNRKLHLYSHIQWKPIPPAVSPDHPPPETTSVIGHEMGLKLSPHEQHYTPWLIVKKSEMGKKRTTGKKQQKLANEDEEYDAGLGLFAARNFLPGDVITVYFGVRARKEDTDKTRRLAVARGKVLDVLADASGNRPLYFGAHFANTPYIDCTTAEDYTKFDRNNWSGKNANCIIDGCLITCTSRIEKFHELRLDYGHRPKN